MSIETLEIEALAEMVPEIGAALRHTKPFSMAALWPSNYNYKGKTPLQPPRLQLAQEWIYILICMNHPYTL